MMLTSGPGTPERCAAPFFFATSAARMGHDVSLFFTMQATQLLKQGVADMICVKEGGRPISQFIRNALDAGVKFYVCSASLELNEISQTDLIEEVDSLVSSIFLTKKGLESDLVLSF
ncbi:MAG: DsrE family protein [Bacteroidota bacterium]